MADAPAGVLGVRDGGLAGRSAVVMGVSPFGEVTAATGAATGTGIAAAGGAWTAATGAWSELRWRGPSAAASGGRPTRPGGR